MLDRPDFVAAAPTLPTIPWIRLPPASPDRHDDHAAKASHLHSDNQRLAAHHRPSDTPTHAFPPVLTDIRSENHSPSARIPTTLTPSQVAAFQTDQQPVLDQVGSSGTPALFRPGPDACDLPTRLTQLLYDGPGVVLLHEAPISSEVAASAWLRKLEN